MSKTMRATRWIALAGAAAITSGCSFDPIPIDRVFCGADVDCPASFICVERVCEPLGGVGGDAGVEPDEGTRADSDPTENNTLDCIIDEDRDGFFVGPGCEPSRVDCRDDDLDIYPGAPTRCNGQDNDCDGFEDTSACDCQEGDERPCGTNEGACVAGVQTCVDGAFGDCVDQIGPAEEVCDGLDNDCDGDVDEPPPAGADACDVPGALGVCGKGTIACINATSTCVSEGVASAEVCDGLDNDCDGDVDEDARRLALARPCGAGTCPDLAVQLCQEGEWQLCGATDVEVCDGTDSNCDQFIDNRSRCVRVCGADTIWGTLSCDGPQVECELPDELCGDGEDNDCDGQVDEGCMVGALRKQLFIPGGTFVMGALTNDPDRQSDEEPASVVDLSPYYLDRTEVSRAEYFACVDAGQCRSPLVSGGCSQQSFNGADGDLPIACVSHQDAVDYCAWVGMRLPTEAEWEKGARGPFRFTRRFPWGDDADVSRAVMGCQGSLDGCVQSVHGMEGSASPYGMLNAAGNVAEFVSDYYYAFYYQTAPTTDPERSTFTLEGHVIRGGSWSQEIGFGRVTNRAAETFGSFESADVGFRCAQTP